MMFVGNRYDPFRNARRAFPPAAISREAQLSNAVIATPEGRAVQEAA